MESVPADVLALALANALPVGIAAEQIDSTAIEKNNFRCECMHFTLDSV
jgi:hypothetical protein